MNYKFLVKILFIFLASPAIATKNFSIDEATIYSIHQAMLNKQLNCEQLINLYFDKIKKYNLSSKHHAPLNAFTEINPSVFDEARQLDKQFSQNQKLVGPLHCIPVVLKDNIDSIDTTTSAGSYALLGNQPIQDAFLTKQLRQAGAVILAKGAMDEFAFGAEGINSRNGRVGNAYDPTKNPGGSSAGVAVAVSSNFAMVGIGTDNSGSIRIPAAFNGLVGLRPSTGLISQSGIYPMGKLDGVAGPLTRTVKDLAIVLDTIAKPDEKDQKTIPLPREKSYVLHLKENGLKGKRIGIVQQVGKVQIYKDMPADIKKILENSKQQMRALGATIVDNIKLEQFDSNRDFNQAGEIEDVNEYLSSFPAVRDSFTDICNSDRTRTFGNKQECLKFITSIPKRNSAEYKKALIIFEQNKNYVEKIMRKKNLDALFMPITAYGIADYNLTTGYTGRAPVSSNAGLPAITFNIGYLNGLPIGIELIAKQFQEGTLIEIAYAYEIHSPPRQVPKLPEPNEKLSHFSIAQLNNLISIIGKASYEQVLKHSNRMELTPQKFKNIVQQHEK